MMCTSYFMIFIIKFTNMIYEQKVI